MSEPILSQNACSIPLRGDETYVISIEIEEPVLIARCPCTSIWKKKKCYLYKIKIEDSYYISDTTIYNKQTIQKVNYFLSFDKILLEKNFRHSIYSRSSDSKKYLIFTRTCIYKPSVLANSNFHHEGGYIGGDLMECLKYKRNPFIRYIKKKES